jgi:hypothetical protein
MTTPSESPRACPALTGGAGVATLLSANLRPPDPKT